ncbi:SO_0444 family Cu/Zn efflux transporter [Desulfonatronospira sp.]|uniref:SO_0444 family Cu/Zn efflux transporter n=1 Tax=Desulfonatronospira sp. TaxID=1962951 RepID=UPI0025C0443D|nr:SO_0444 family Cu/Zn efflux transporter [Desulfonatronospira sp.]
MILQNILSISLTAAPWLLLGLFTAGLIKALIPETALQRWVGGHGPGVVVRATLIGAPLPLCSCGAIPTALALYRGGAGRGPATAFLIGTPGVGADSLAITYALLGPVMTLARALGAVAAGIVTGLMVSLAGTPSHFASIPAGAEEEPCPCSTAGTGCAGDSSIIRREPLAVRIKAGMLFAFHDLFRDIIPWIFLGLIIAGLLITLVPPQALAAYGSGVWAMLLMAVAGIPMYICAAAATPISAGMIMAGVSPGTALVFLLAAPITSLSTLGVLYREMGRRTLVLYTAGILVTTVLLGLSMDQLVALAGIDIAAQSEAVGDLLPAWLEWTGLVLLVLLTAFTAFKSVRGTVYRR